MNTATADHSRTFQYLWSLNYSTRMYLWLLFTIGFTQSIDINEFYRSFEEPMHRNERQSIRQKVITMLLHSYESYKKICQHTCDVVKPITCEAHYYRNGAVTSNEFYGNFSLTLIETADTLALMGLYDEFYDSVQKIITYVNFDIDVVVSVFEINIRILGGLLSTHYLIHALKPIYPKFNNYNNELVAMAVDIGDRLMIAFEKSPSGIPYKKIYLKTLNPVYSFDNTSTADAGTFVLEFCTLTNLTGNRKYCEAALRALDRLWSLRNPEYGLPNTFLSTKSLNWSDNKFTLGSGVDSYYEYLLKGYIMTGNSTLYIRFNEHYKSIEKYLKKNYAYADVYLYSNLQAMNSVDSFQAFWPSIQLMHGDWENSLHYYYYFFKAAVSHTLLPEKISLNSLESVDSSFHLRPEFIESTYYLYKATKDPFFLNVGKFIVYATENYCRSKCGYSSLSSVRGTKLDQTETFFMAEYLKYLYLLFSVDDNDQPINIENYVFNTEAHLLPIFNVDSHHNFKDNHIFQNMQYCKDNILYNSIENIRQDRLRVLNDIESTTKISEKLFNDFHFHLFDEKNQSHHQFLISRNAGYHSDKNNQIFTINFDYNNENGTFISERVYDQLDLYHKLINYKSKKSEMEKPVFIRLPATTTGGTEFILQVGVAFFGRAINKNFDTLIGSLSKANPFDACSPLTNRNEISGKIVVAIRGNCNFLVKARNIQRFGGIAAYILNNQQSNDVVIHMISDDYNNDILIPTVFLSLLDSKNKDTSTLHKNILSMNNQKLQSINSTIFSTSFSINIVFN